MTYHASHVGRRWVAAAAGAALLVGSAARAHQNPAPCFETGPALILSAFRANGTTGVVGSVSECETIFFRARLSKTADQDTQCAFSGGSFTLTTPDGTVHTIDDDVPCIGGDVGDSCDPARDFIEGFIPYTVSTADMTGGAVTAVTRYSGGVSHDSAEDSPGVAVETAKSAPVVLCGDDDPCTTDVCDPAQTGAAACSNPPVLCDDGDVCTSDTCDPQSGACMFTPSTDPICTSEAVCRTPGFWGTHGGVTEQVIGLAGGCLEVCGEVVTAGTASSVGSASSALEAICVSPRGDQRLQLARQLTAMALNCALSGFGPDCVGKAALATLFGECSAACEAGSGVGDCIAAVDCFNNGGSFDPESGLCGADPSGSCHARALPDTVEGGPADTPGACNRARRNACTVLGAGESSCTSGTQSSSPESCS